MKIPFVKYQGTGNDFVIIDNRSRQYDLSNEQVIAICDRKFGVGSDGLILIQEHPDLDFEMVFYNPDSSQSFCGNGSRCAVHYALELRMFEGKTRFLSTDGEHSASMIGTDAVSLKMHDVNEVEQIANDLFLNTGSPHYIIKSENNAELDIIEEARKIRYNDRFSADGVNVNFIQYDQDAVQIRTYERGVENETLSCGTGVTAAALAKHVMDHGTEGAFSQKVISQGGNLEVRFNLNGGQFTDIYLNGPAKRVFDGTIDV